MADSGANICVTNDPTILLDMIDIDPIPLGVAATSPDTPTTFCTKQGYLPIPLLDGSYHYQPFLYNPNATDTILSPAHVMWSSPSICSWHQSGSKDSSVTDTLSFLDSDGNDLLVLPLTTHNGLQYCTNAPTPHAAMRSTITYSAATVSAASAARRVLESELWAARLGYCSEWQLAKIPLHADGTPSKFFPHPLRLIDHKEQARVRKQPAGSQSEQAPCQDSVS